MSDEKRTDKIADTIYMAMQISVPLVASEDLIDPSFELNDRSALGLIRSHCDTRILSYPDG